MTAIPDWRVADAEKDAKRVELINWSSVWWDGEGLNISVNDDAERPLFRLIFARGAMFDVIPAERLIVAVKHTDDISPLTITHLLADQVEPRILAHEGVFIVHASAIEVDGAVVLFVGDSGVGKSTLAASFDQSGIPMLCDDAVIVEFAKEQATGRALYPSLRLHPDSLEALLPDLHPSLAPAYHGMKRRLDLPFQSRKIGAALPLAAIFSLVASRPTGGVAINAISPAELCMALVANCFSLNPADLNRAGKKLRVAGSIADRIPAFSLTYPRDYGLLPDVQAAILETVRQTV